MAQLSEYGNYSLPSEGLASRAVLVSFVDLGMQTGNFEKPSRNAQLSFELIDEKTADGKPVLANMRLFNLSLKSRKCREFIRAMTGQHDITRVNTKDLIGKECCLAITHKTTDTSVVAEVEAKAMKGPPSGYVPVTETTFVSLHPEDFDEGALNDLPDWMSEKIRKSTTYVQLKADMEAAKKSASDIIDDALPDFDAPKFKKSA